MASLTSTNSVFILTAEGIYSGVRVEGFASDDAFTFSTTEIGAGFMGVDGKFSTAYTPAPCPQDIFAVAVMVICLRRFWKHECGRCLLRRK